MIEAFRPVHGGAMSSWTKTEVECNAYCNLELGIHCDIVYGGDEDWREIPLSELTEEMNDRMELSKALEIVRIEEAREAPPPDFRFFAGPGQRPEVIRAWLMFWKAKS